MKKEMNERFVDYHLEPVFRIPNTEQLIVPHYVKPHEWVGLGNETWTTKQLLDSKAKPEFKCMWTRPWVEKVIFRGKSRTISISELSVLMRAKL